MLRAHTVEQVRAAERELMATLPDGVLMQRAATGLAHAVLDLLATTGATYGRRVLLLVGGGDNGGDALWAGARLVRRGVAAEALLLAGDAHAEGLAAFRAAGGRVVDAPSRRPDLVLDGIVGIGGRAGLRPGAQAALDLVADVPVVAVDTPSGIDVDTGELGSGTSAPHVEATLTVTFGTRKIAHLVDPAAAACGAVHLVDLGLALPPPAAEALQTHDVARLLPRPGGASQKYSRGVVGIRAGSEQYPGAALLSTAGAACGLVGMVRYVGPAAVAGRVRQAHPEVVGDGRVQAWVVGSGGGDGAGEMLEEALDDGVPVLVDADGLSHVDGPLPVPAVLTPHAGELATLLDADRADVEARMLHHARAAADRFGTTVLLKGRRTVVAHPDGRVRVNLTGTSWLATAGAGDVLGGLVGALLAAGLEPFDAASVGAWLHGSAATRAGGGAGGDGSGGDLSGGPGGPITAGAVAAALPATIRALL